MVDRRLFIYGGSGYKIKSMIQKNIPIRDRYLFYLKQFNLAKNI